VTRIAGRRKRVEFLDILDLVAQWLVWIQFFPDLVPKLMTLGEGIGAYYFEQEEKIVHSDPVHEISPYLHN